VFRNVLSAETVAQLTEASDQSLARQSSSHFDEEVAAGSMILIDWQFFNEQPAFAELVADPSVSAALGELGFPEPRFGHGRIISKPPRSPQLYWHRDGRFWNDPTALTPLPRQVFLMFYLVDTSPKNGCLRVVPGSHLRSHPMDHVVGLSGRTAEQQTFADPSHPSFGRFEGEIDVPLKAGDFVAGYSELLHSAHANSSDAKRTCLTMWYYPAFAELPRRSQASIAAAEVGGMTSSLSQVQDPGVADRLRAYEITYDGDAAADAYESTWEVPTKVLPRL
jgi:ectoine hydroxylase-related dioxygenase (phytanoyl-CoA dioxygenase family)